MKIKKLQDGSVNVTFEFNSRDFFLVNTENKDTSDEWSLNPKIDRSYKGKGEDCACPIIFLSDEEAKELKPHFDQYYLNIRNL